MSTPVCPHDGALLYANGWCPLGGGFPLGRPCPFVCDRCRRPLAWSGTCLHCPEGYAPGDRYEYTDGDPHWRLTEQGPFTLCSPEENLARAKVFVQSLFRAMVR